jgi:hypothetical protein
VNGGLTLRKHELLFKNKTLSLLAIVAAYFAVSASGERVIPWLQGTPVESALIQLGWTNTIVFNLAIGYLVSLFFWLIVVHLPERKRRAMLRNKLDRTYKYFKEDIVQTLLWALNAPYESAQIEQLATDHIAFKNFFGNDNKSIWGAALNGMQDSEERLREVYFAMESLSLEVTYVLSSLPIQDENAHTFLKHLNETIRRLKHYDTAEYDRVKYIGSFLWGIFARWDILSGQMQDDPLQATINRL